MVEQAVGPEVLVGAVEVGGGGGRAAGAGLAREEGGVDGDADLRRVVGRGGAAGGGAAGIAPGPPALAAQATFSLNRRVGQAVSVGDGLRLGIGSVAKGNPCITIEGVTIGDGLRITLIRPAGSYVRIGVEAPGRRVYRRELWDDMVASNKAAAGEDDDLSALLAAEPGPAAGTGGSRPPVAPAAAGATTAPAGTNGEAARGAGTPHRSPA